jgi:hypothetical protein
MWCENRQFERKFGVKTEFGVGNLKEDGYVYAGKFKNQKMKKIHLLLMLIPVSIIVMVVSGYRESSHQLYTRKEGFVPDEATAIKIAEAIWLPIYGKQVLERKPYKAELDSTKTKWIVVGTLHKKKGGEPCIVISKSDCKILLVSHGK